MVVTIDILNVAIIRTEEVTIFIVGIGECLTVTDPCFRLQAIEIVVNRSIVKVKSIPCCVLI
jgi:hypothetical protein